MDDPSLGRVTPTPAAEAELGTCRQVLSAMADAVPAGLFQVDAAHTVTFANDRLLAMLRSGPAETLEQQLAAVALEDVARWRDAVTAVFDGTPVDDVEINVDLPPSNGNRRRRERRVCRLALRPVTADGVVTGAVGCLTDVTETLALRRQVERHDAMDELTSCANRAATLAQVADELATPESARRGCAVVFVDLNGLKLVNERHGPVIGDELLRQAAARMRNAMRTGDVVGRLGGDEFLVVSPDVDNPAVAVQMGERIRRALHADIKIAGFTVLLRASVGVAWTDQPIDAMTLVRQADTAMYQSKTTPGFPAVLYHSRPATPTRRPAPLTRVHASR